MKAIYIATCHLVKGGDSQKSPIVEVSGKCLYKNGDFSIYKHCEKAYYFLWKNVIVSEFTGINKELADLLAKGQKPDRMPQRYHYESALQDIEEAPGWAKEYNFKIQ